MSITQSGRGHASGYEVVHASREFRTLRRHLGSFAGMQVRALTGVGAERGDRA